MSVLVVAFQMSEAIATPLVRVRVPEAHTLAGIEVIALVIEASVAPSDDEAAVTTELTFAVAVSVCAFTPVVTPAVAVLVLLFMFEASEVEAVSTAVFVFPLITAARDEDAVVTSLCTARLPDVRPEHVSVRVVAFQISDAIATPLVRERVPLAQTFAGKSH